MANTKISAATAATSISMADMLPLAKASDSTAYFATAGQLIGGAGVMAMSAASIVGATSITLRSVPAWTANYGGFLIIDPGVVTCEVRHATWSSTTASFTTGLAYAHTINSNVLWAPGSLLYDKWFGSRGDGSTSDYTALARALVQAGYLKSGVLVSYGVHPIGTGLVLPESTSLIGESAWGCELKATADITMLQVDTGDSAGLRNYRVENLRINGNSTASIGMSVGAAPLSSFRNLDVNGCTGTRGIGIAMDYSQNQKWDTVRSTANGRNWYIINGSANCDFSNCHGTAPVTDNLTLTRDATSPFVGPASSPSGHGWYSCIFETGTGDGTAARPLFMEYATRLLFAKTNFTRHASSTVPCIDGETTADDITFLQCRVNSNSVAAVDMAQIDGTNILFENCAFTDLNGSTTLVKVNQNAAWVNFNSPIPTNGVFTQTAGYIHPHMATQFLVLPRIETQTIADGAITITRSNVAVAGQGGVADNLDTINGGEVNTILFLSASSASVTITVRDDGNINLNGAVDFDLDHTLDQIVLKKNSSGDWDEISRSDNG